MKQMKHVITLITVVVMLATGIAFAGGPSCGGGGHGHGCGPKIDQDQDACVLQGALQIGICLPKTQVQEQLACIEQDQLVKGVRRGKVDQDQDACIAQLAGQFGLAAKQEQCLSALIDQDQIVRGSGGRGCGGRPRRPNIDQEQNACILQVGFQAGAFAKQDQLIVANIIQSQLTKVAGGKHDQSQSASVVQISSQIGVGVVKQTQYQGTVITQTQIQK